MPAARCDRYGLPGSRLVPQLMAGLLLITDFGCRNVLTVRQQRRTRGDARVCHLAVSARTRHGERRENKQREKRHSADQRGLPQAAVSLC